MIEVVCNDRLGKKVRVKCKYPSLVNVSLCHIYNAWVIEPKNRQFKLNSNTLHCMWIIWFNLTTQEVMVLC